MALGIPLPRVVADVEPGGQYLTARRAQNAFARDEAQLHKQNLMNQMLEIQAASAPTTMQQKIDQGMAQNRLLDLRAQYYGPQQEAQIAQRQAAAQRMQALTPLEAQQKQFQLNALNPLKQQQLQQQVEGFPEMQAAKLAQQQAATQRIQTLTPLEAKKAQLAAQQQQFQLGTLNPLKQQQLQQQVEAFPAMTAAKEAQLRRTSEGRSGAAGTAQKRFNRIVAEDHPDWDQATVRKNLDAYYLGNSQLPDGTEIPRLGGRALAALGNVRKYIAPAALQMKTASMRGLLADMKDINIKAPMFFAGLKGQAKAAKYAIAMTAGRPVPEIYREYLAFKKVLSKATMDKMRQAFGSSVRPAFVIKFIGPLADPQSTIWHDSKQVEKNWKASLGYVQRNTDQLIRMTNVGVTAPFDDSGPDIIPEGPEVSIKHVPKGARYWDMDTAQMKVKK